MIKKDNNVIPKSIGIMIKIRLVRYFLIRGPLWCQGIAPLTPREQLLLAIS